MSKNKKRKTIALLVCLLLFTVCVIRMLWANTAVVLTSYTVEDADLPSAFDGFRIAQVSDLHNAEMGENNEDLLAMLREASPDIIVLTGDLIDSRRTDIAVSIAFAAQAARIAPTYYVSGNHEARVAFYEELKEALIEVGVVVLENESLTLYREENALCLIGLQDPSFAAYDWFDTSEEKVIRDALTELMPTNNRYTIVLSHRPELFSVYVSCGADLVFSGHTHGGQIRLPLVGGIIAPDQGLFPTYDAGIFMQDETTMIVSCGIGNSIVPLRVNNRPELVLVELQKQ